jgi:hypothetical protein
VRAITALFNMSFGLAEKPAQDCIPYLQNSVWGPLMSPMIKAVALSVLVTFLASPVVAEPTHVMIRAQAQDAKFIGDHMGGVEVKVTDAHTGKILAQGLIRGGTGDTALVVKAPRVRGGQISDKDTAGFDAVLDITEPTLVRVEAVGPVGKPAASINVSSSLWVIPGRNIGGDGVILTFPGLVVEPTATVERDGLFHLQAKISPMCGCPIDTGGLWDAANYAVQATLMRGGKAVVQAPLAFTGKTGEFAANLPKPAEGRYTVRFVATDARTPNAGVVTLNIEVGR